MPEEKDDKGFKVIDRRGREEPPSPSSGEKVPSTATAGQEPPSPPPVENPGSASTEGKAPEIAGGSPPKHPGGGIGGAEEGKGPSSLGVPRFLDLVQSLQMGAMIGLGMIQDRDGKRPPIDLPAAKDAIDLLGILQEKTKGNLTKEEEEVLREGLYHLRMGYMAMINAPPAGRGKGGESR
jgi:Domain of unknown function (DUF1844)